MSTDIARQIATNMFEAAFEAKYGVGDIVAQTIVEKGLKRFGGKLGSSFKSGAKSSRETRQRGLWELTNILAAPSHSTPRARLNWMGLSGADRIKVTKPFRPLVNELAAGL